MELGKNIKRARNRAGLTQEQVGCYLGVTQQTVRGWEGGIHGVSSTNLHRLAEVCGVTVDALYTGDFKDENVEQARPLGRAVPVISWVAASQWSEAVDMYEPGDAGEWIPAPCPVSDKAFMLRVVGRSMEAQYGESYPEGSLILVDPELRTPASGEPVVARMVDTGTVTFKVYVEDGGKPYLRPLNSTHLPLTEPFEVIGTVIAKIELRR